ncbi:uncharacterized protein LOC131237985 [Magnolia sinica]|uniref:uncharacterized protein LOC131237985 n=1 Tax=Magnolia sinica TaxID=86752 RepID=UPI002659EA95|nr:uncharacterized protein LOC131237985 [Magnolia sinica]
MALLLSCWLAIEIILIPHGFEKWYRLSFFIHPVLLVLCQIFLWAQFLASGILILIIHPLKRIWYAFLWVFRLLRNRVMSMNFQCGPDDYGVTQGSGTYEAFGVNGPIQSIVLYHSYRDAQIIDGSKGVLGDNRDLSEEEEDNEEESDVQVYGDSEADESSSLNCSSESVSLMCSSESSIAERVGENTSEEEDVTASLMCSSELSIAEGVVENRCEEEDVQIDEFYNKYTERMKWFDLLNYERTCGINADAGAILNKKMGNSSLLESNIEPVNFSLPYINCSKETRRKLIRSLESDFELVYVGQTCLCWEALHHQYRKVEALADTSTCIRSAFYEKVAGKFQQFQVLLERFMENERIGGQRFWNYVQSRLPLKYLLQVPEIPGIELPLQKKCNGH